MLRQLLLLGPASLQLPLTPLIISEKRPVLERSLLVELEEIIVFVLIVLSLAQPKPGNSKLMVQSSQFTFQSIDLPDVVLDIVSCG